MPFINIFTTFYRDTTFLSNISFEAFIMLFIYLFHVFSLSSKLSLSDNFTAIFSKVLTIPSSIPPKSTAAVPHHISHKAPAICSYLLPIRSAPDIAVLLRWIRHSCRPPRSPYNRKSSGCSHTC